VGLTLVDEVQVGLFELIRFSRIDFNHVFLLADIAEHFDQASMLLCHFLLLSKRLSSIKMHLQLR